jgi:hypothetical protein
MIGCVGLHRADHADVVDVLSRPREDLADLDAALPILLKPKRGGQGGPGLSFRRQVSLRQHFAFVFLEKWLGVKRIDLRRPTI